MFWGLGFRGLGLSFGHLKPVRVEGFRVLDMGLRIFDFEQFCFSSDLAVSILSSFV